MLLLIDNYDSFTFNLAQYLGELGAAPTVRRNDEITLDQVRALAPDRIVISPGPGRPEDAGVSIAVIREFGGRVPMLGVCLGHQAIGAAFGAAIVRAPVLMHGKTSLVDHDGRGLFRGMTGPFEAGRYHSLAVSEDGWPAELEVAARAAELHKLLPKRKLILGIDRLDYTKGIPLRLKAFHTVLTRYPELRERISLIQVVVPSREDIPEYHRLRTEIEQLVGKINGQFARPGGWVPIWYEYRSLSRLELVAYYRAADIALITPLKDGMNLVAKEYCTCSIEEDCVLILSEFAGAATQLYRGALLVNPYDIEGVADAIHRACGMDPAERHSRMHRMRVSIRENDVFFWVDSYLRAAITKDLRAFPQPEGRIEEDALEYQLPF